MSDANWKKAFGERIAGMRRVLKLDEKEFAGLLRLASPSTLNAIESGRGNFGMKVLRRLAENIEVDLNWLIRGKPLMLNGKNVIGCQQVNGCPIIKSKKQAKK